MKLSFKMDESLSPSLAQILVARDHDVATVPGEGLKGQPDEVVAGVRRREGRCLVTADADFGQVLAYPPEQYSGIVVLQHPRPTLAGFRTLVGQLAVAIASQSPVGKLWIVEPGRLRIHDPADS